MTDGWYILYTCLSHALVFLLGYIANSCYKTKLAEWETSQEAALDQRVTETERSVASLMKSNNHNAAVSLTQSTIAHLAWNRRKEHVDTGAMKHLLAKVYLAQRAYVDAGECTICDIIACIFSRWLGYAWTLGGLVYIVGLALSSIPFSVPSHIPTIPYTH